MTTLAAGASADTIFALASGVGRSAIAVVRLSGQEVATILTALCGPLPPPRLASLRRVRDRQGAVLDQAILLWLPGPASYTGEDTAELHVHGGRAVLDAVMHALVLEGCRPAEPGEFSRRAYFGGKLDLLEAEAVADLVDADTELQRTQALRQLSGEHSRILRDWSARLTRCLASQEALIDFADEDLPTEVEGNLLDELARLRAEMRQHLGAIDRGQRLRRGLVFVISGAPNVGKSSLLNALAGREAAIVSPLPGTTRDPVQVELVLGGVPVSLVDTAGLRDTDHPVEAEGIRRARAQARAADLVIEVIEAGSLPSSDTAEATVNSLRVSNKIDVAPGSPGLLGVSARTGTGIPSLLAELTARAVALADPGNHPVLTRARHQAVLLDAEAAISTALHAVRPELRAEDLRRGLDALGRMTGHVGSEAVLGVVFNAFCIGK